MQERATLKVNGKETAYEAVRKVGRSKVYWKDENGNKIGLIRAKNGLLVRYKTTTEAEQGG